MAQKQFELLEDRFGCPKGTIVYEFIGYDYGLARDDTHYCNEEHICVSEDSNTKNGCTFFTAPVRILREL